jgi:hypothetical protein
MIRALFPGRSPPAFSYIGRAAREVGGAGRLAELLWQASSRPPTGDLLLYCQAMAKNRQGRTPELPDPVKVRERVHQILSQEGQDGNLDPGF